MKFSKKRLEKDQDNRFKNLSLIEEKQVTKNDVLT